jgi:hypothetical protein
MSDDADMPEEGQTTSATIDLRDIVVPEPTDEENAEERRRWQTISAGRHPDTNRSLRQGDENSLRAKDRAYVRIVKELNIARYGEPYPTASDRAVRDIVKLQDRLGTYRDLDLWAQLPVPKHTGLDAIARIIEHWRIAGALPEHAATLSPGTYSYLDAVSSVVEAQRMLSVYGPTIAEQRSFLTEYRANLGLLQGLGLSEAIAERADLLSRLALPTKLAKNLKGYDNVSINIIQRYGESAILELKEDYKREENPTFALQAVSIAIRYGIEFPEWILDYLGSATDNIMTIFDEVADGSRAGKEAARVGKALGFGTEGPGRGGWFKRASILERDRNIFFQIGDRIETGMKLDFAYDDVAKALSISRASVVRAHLRVKALRSDLDDNEVS